MRCHVVDDGGILFTMIAPSEDDIPTAILPGPNAGGLHGYAQELVDVFRADVAAIASRMGSYTTRLEVDDDVTKSIFKVTTELSSDAGYVLVDRASGALAAYLGDTTPMGFEEGKSFSDWQDEHHGSVLTEVQE